MPHRIEKDFLGEKQVAEEAYWGIHTQRALENFSISGYRMNPSLVKALAMVKKNATAKFDESIDVAVQLGVDAKKSDQLVRGSVVLPKGTGKTMRVAVLPLRNLSGDPVARGMYFECNSR